MKKLKNLIKKTCREIRTSNKGEGFIDTIVKMLIVVVVGALLLGLLNIAIPGLFNDIIAKIRTTFGL